METAGILLQPLSKIFLYHSERLQTRRAVPVNIRHMAVYLWTYSNPLRPAFVRNSAIPNFQRLQNNSPAIRSYYRFLSTACKYYLLPSIAGSLANHAGKGSSSPKDCKAKAFIIPTLLIQSPLLSTNTHTHLPHTNHPITMHPIKFPSLSPSFPPSSFSALCCSGTASEPSAFAGDMREAPQVRRDHLYAGELQKGTNCKICVFI